MERLRKRRCSVWLMSVLVVGLVVLIISPLVRSPQAGILLYALPGTYFLTVCGCVLWFELVQPLTMNGDCPACHRRGMRKIARSSTFFECVYCRARLKRSSPTAEWEDASSADADTLYRATPEGGHWNSYEVPDPGDTTCGQLLRSKRSRDGMPAVDQEASVHSLHATAENVQGSGAV